MQSSGGSLRSEFGERSHWGGSRFDHAWAMGRTRFEYLRELGSLDIIVLADLSVLINGQILEFHLQAAVSHLQL